MTAPKMWSGIRNFLTATNNLLNRKGSTMDTITQNTPTLNTTQKYVLDHFRTAGYRGLTSEELHRRFFVGAKESTSRTRISELVKLGLIRATGVYRPSSAGRRMTVWAIAA